MSDHDHSAGAPGHVHGSGCRCSIIPDYIMERLAESDAPEARATADKALAARAQLFAAPHGPLGQVEAPGERIARAAMVPPLSREVFDLKGRTDGRNAVLARAEGAAATGDAAVDEAFDYSGTVHRFFHKVFGRQSIDDKGMKLVSAVHYGRNVANAFWTGDQMVYGDGDGKFFTRFTKSLDVVAHELGHGVTERTSGLVYRDQPGALNEHFSDVFGTLAKQWHLGQTVDKADWLIGAELIGEGLKTGPNPVRAIRIMTGEKAYKDNPTLGTDPQPKHMRDLYRGREDNGGVHINSGIPNFAFYTTAMKLGGYSWGAAGQIWYKTLLRLPSDADFQKAAHTTFAVAGELYGPGSKEQRAVHAGWQAVGLEADPTLTSQPRAPRRQAPTVPGRRSYAELDTLVTRDPHPANDGAFGGAAPVPTDRRVRRAGGGGLGGPR